MEPGSEERSEFHIFGVRYPLPRIDSDNQTKENILINATLLFARNGYASVSMRDIAATIGIKSASLYNHFSSKEILWQEVLAHSRELYLLYFNHLDLVLEKAETFEEILDVIFDEPKKMTNVFTCYAFSMIQVEQFRDPEAGRMFNDVFLKYSIEVLQTWFERCIARGLVREFDANAVATMIIHSVLIGVDVKVQEYLGRDLPYDPSQMIASLQRFLQTTLRAK